MNAQVSKVFQKHYKAYISQLAGLDLAETGHGAGGRIHTGPENEIRVAIPYFNKSYFVSAQGVENEAGNQPGYDICTILCRYLIMAQTWTKGPLPSGNPGWVNFRDLKDSGPLTVYFRDNTEAAIPNALAGKEDRLPDIMAPFNGTVPDLDLQYDLALEITALPKLPLLLLYNAAEPGFPAACSVLFQKNAETFLDAECLAMAGYRLASLVKAFAAAC